MVIPVLVLTPNTGLGELICQILDETGEYAVTLVTKGSEALSTAEKDKPALVILETKLNGTPAGELLSSMRAALPELLVLLITDEDKTGNASYAGLQPDGLLEKPVYLPDLVSKVQSVIENSDLDNLKRAQEKGKATKPTAPSLDLENPPAPAWLNDVNLAAQHLIRLSLESSAQASLITKGDEIWAYAGELPRPAAEELARAVSVHFVNGGGSDLARFIRLEENGGEYMLYATGLGGEYVLATVFNAETPFSKIRAQANQLAEALSTEPPPQPENDLDLEPEADEEDLGNLWPMLEDVPPPIPNGWVPESSLNQPESQQDSLLDELLEGAKSDAFSSETMAIPIVEMEELPQNNIGADSEVEEDTTLPEPEPQELEQVLPTAEAQLQEMEQVPPPAAAQHQDQEQVASSASAQPQDREQVASSAAAQHQDQEQVASSAASQVTQPSASAEYSDPTIASSVPPESLVETVISRSARRSDPEPKGSNEISLDPVSPSMYNLTYACVLIPRFPAHHLSGEVAKRLSDWINHLTVAFGWRLEQLSVRPEYMQWMVNVPPNTSPGYLMRTIRQHTSRRMFIEFPFMEADNPSGDFWAPGYLILGNPQPPPPALVQEFIHNTRKRQGLVD